MAETKPTRSGAPARTPAKRTATKRAAVREVAAPVETERRTTRVMTDAHKEALSTGREEGRAVRNYLEAIDRPKRRGRKKTVDTVARRIDQLDGRLAKASPSERLRLIQQRFDLKSELDALAADAALDLHQLEDAFIKVASDYSERKGISYAAWREAGVSPSVLRSAGIARTRVH